MTRNENGHPRKAPDSEQRKAAWESVRLAVAGQPVVEPPVEVHSRVMARIRQPQRASAQLTGRAWLGAGGLALVILALLWIVVQPGVVLAWDSGDVPASAYRVYRAPLDSSEFELVAEVPTSESSAYTYVDLFLLPWQAYTYRVEGMAANGQMVTSQAVTGRALEALPGQLALVIASVLSGLALMMLLQNMLGFFNKLQQYSNIFPRLLS